ncbi:hypothetical protein O3P69_020117 [Scylla paramamosain]|uniref:Uncharacterized protein n=1 Tax=Scylla paramamosain TaxID=85552 RepID=A0AAW0TLC9_SCYPA
MLNKDSIAHDRRAKHTHPQYVFHRFPKEGERSITWQNVVKSPHIEGKTVEQLHRSYKVCSLHFSPRNYVSGLPTSRLRSDACPDQNLESNQGPPPAVAQPPPPAVAEAPPPAVAQPPPPAVAQPPPPAVAQPPPPAVAQPPPPAVAQPPPPAVAQSSSSPQPDNIAAAPNKDTMLTIKSGKMPCLHRQAKVHCSRLKMKNSALQKEKLVVHRMDQIPETNIKEEVEPSLTVPESFVDLWQYEGESREQAQFMQEVKEEFEIKIEDEFLALPDEPFIPSQQEPSGKQDTSKTRLVNEAERLVSCGSGGRGVSEGGMASYPSSACTPKRKNLSLAQKMEVIADSEKGMSRMQLMERYGLKKTTLHDILKAKDKWASVPGTITISAKIDEHQFLLKFIDIYRDLLAIWKTEEEIANEVLQAATPSPTPEDDDEEEEETSRPSLAAVIEATDMILRHINSVGGSLARHYEVIHLIRMEMMQEQQGKKIQPKISSFFKAVPSPADKRRRISVSSDASVSSLTSAASTASLHIESEPSTSCSVSPVISSSGLRHTTTSSNPLLCHRRCLTPAASLHVRMQPPPRKGNYLKVCKNLHSEQLSKLLAKNQQECDLLEDIRNFTKQRSSIEKSYGEALCKIAANYQNRKIACVPDIRLEDGSDAWNVYSVWRTVLDETEKLGKARLAAVEVFQQNISEDAKVTRQNKIHLAKKFSDQLKVAQGELQTQVQELERAKRNYYEEEHVAHDAREKASAAEERLKRKKGSIFQSIQSLQKNSAKFSAKRDACDEKSAGARNDYLLTLAASNAHQRRYYEVDFERFLRTMECDMYDKVAEYLTLMSRTELLTCSATQSSFNKIKEQATTVTRGYNLRCYLTFYPMLGQNIQYDYEPCEGDSIEIVTVHDDATQTLLEQEGRRCVTTIQKDVKNIREATRKIQKLNVVGKHEYDLPPDIESKLDEQRLVIRRAETSKVKMESKIEVLKEGGVEVEDYAKSLDSDSLGVEAETSLSRSESTLSVREEVEAPPVEYEKEEVESNAVVVSSGPESTATAEYERGDSAQTQDDGRLDPGMWDPMNVDWGDVPVSPLPPVTNGPPEDAGTFPKCTVLYNYTAQNPDELTIVENEELELMGEGDGDGWVQARNYKGEVGYIPQNYIEMEDASAGGVAPTAAPPDAAPAPAQEVPTTAPVVETSDAAAISFSSIEYNLEQGGGYDEVEEYSSEPPPDLPPPPPAITTTTAPPAAVPPAFSLPVETNQLHQGDFCRAVYDYEATCAEEITFCEGQIIRILKRTVHDVDDGWWEGEVDGQVGLFPSLVVEECRSDGEPLTPDLPPPPDHTRPDQTRPDQTQTPSPSSQHRQVLFPFREKKPTQRECSFKASGYAIVPPHIHTPPEVPGFLLPPERVIITQPTPVVETAEESQMPTEAPPAPPATTAPATATTSNNAATGAVGGGYDSSAFELELSGQHQEQYSRQFSSSPESEATDRDQQYAELVSSPDVSNQEQARQQREQEPSSATSPDTLQEEAGGLVSPLSEARVVEVCEPPESPPLPPQPPQQQESASVKVAADVPDVIQSAESPAPPLPSLSHLFLCPSTTTTIHHHHHHHHLHYK